MLFDISWKQKFMFYNALISKYWYTIEAKTKGRQFQLNLMFGDMPLPKIIQKKTFLDFYKDTYIWILSIIFIIIFLITNSSNFNSNMTIFPSCFFLLHTKVQSLLFVSLVDFQTVCKKMSRPSILSGQPEPKNPKLYYYK